MEKNNVGTKITADSKSACLTYHLTLRNLKLNCCLTNVFNLKYKSHRKKIENK